MNGVILILFKNFKKTTAIIYVAEEVKTMTLMFYETIFMKILFLKDRWISIWNVNIEQIIQVQSFLLNFINQWRNVYHKFLNAKLLVWTTEEILGSKNFCFCTTINILALHFQRQCWPTTFTIAVRRDYLKGKSWVSSVLSLGAGTLGQNRILLFISILFNSVFISSQSLW